MDPSEQDHPIQALFFKLGFVFLLGTIVSGLLTHNGRHYTGLCMPFALLSATFFTLWTWIHVRH